MALLKKQNLAHEVFYVGKYTLNRLIMKNNNNNINIKQMQRIKY